MEDIHQTVFRLFYDTGSDAGFGNQAGAPSHLVTTLTLTRAPPSRLQGRIMILITTVKQSVRCQRCLASPFKLLIAVGLEVAHRHFELISTLHFSGPSEPVARWSRGGRTGRSAPGGSATRSGVFVCRP